MPNVSCEQGLTDCKDHLLTTNTGQHGWRRNMISSPKQLTVFTTKTKAAKPKNTVKQPTTAAFTSSCGWSSWKHVKPCVVKLPASEFSGVAWFALEMLTLPGSIPPATPLLLGSDIFWEATGDPPKPEATEYSTAQEHHQQGLSVQCLRDAKWLYDCYWWLVIDD